MDPDEAIERVDSGRAWDEFCELLRDAGAILQRDDLGLDTFDRAEGLRYLARLTQNGLSSFLENPGPRHPRLRALPEHCGFGLDNPDNVYQSAGINPAFDYRIRGTRGTIAYLSFAAQNQNFARRDRITGGAGHLDHTELELADDGTFEVIASQREHAGNWLALAPDSSMILVRETFADRAHEVAADVHIECIGVTDAPAPIDPALVPDQLLGGAMYAIGASSWFADWVAPWRAEPNRLHFPDPEQHRVVGGDPNIVFQLGYWSLAPDEALIVEATPPRCEYWNFQLGNIWAECLDKRRPISRNLVSTTYEPDGSFRLVVAPVDPGSPNWIDTCGHRHGIMGLRWVRAATHPPATARVVAAAEIATELRPSSVGRGASHSSRASS
jgi:hypothetical protein